jgi:hypothetical protein
MTDERKDLPPTKSANFLEKLREAMQVYLGTRGDDLDKGLTWRHLFDVGMITVRRGTGGRGSVITGPGTVLEPAYEVDLTPPPTPSGFTATAAIMNLLVECDSPAYTAGHGHAKSRLYGSTLAMPVFADAVRLTEFGGTVSSYATNPATTWHLWLTWVTVDGVESLVPAGGTNGVTVTTGQDVALLLDALAGEITTSELATDLNTRIDLIDGNTAQPALPYPLAKLAALQDGLNQRARLDLDQAAVDVLSALTAINNTQQTVSDAGINVNPATGLVEIYGLELANDHLNTVDLRLDAAEGAITLKASTAYVDGAIASATLSPADLILYNGLDVRLTTAEAEIDGLNGQVLLKASTVDLTDAVDRITTAEVDIDSLQGQIALKVNTSEFDLTTGDLETRLGSAETVIAAIGDTASITDLVVQGSRRYRDDAQSAETALLNLLNGVASAEDQRETLAIARQELTAYTDVGVEAEAAQRLTLAATVNANVASIEEEKVARALADSAEASARLALAVLVADNAASIVTEQNARADADTAEANLRIALAAVVDGNQASLVNNYYTKVDTDGAIAASASTLQTTIDGNTAALETQALSIDGIKAQYTVKMDINGVVSGYGLYGSTAGSKFIANVNQFAVTLPSTSIPDWAAGAKALGAIAKISGDTTSGKYLVCVKAGTSSSTAPSIAGLIGTIVTDGSVEWQIASRVPFAVVSAPTTIEGVPLPAGGYFDGAYIRNLNANFITAGTINGDIVNVTKALTAADVTAGAIWTGDVTSTSNTVIEGVSYPSFSINASTGLATFNNAVVRGTVYATAGLIGGNTIDATSIHSGSTGYGTGGGFYLGSDGRFSLSDKLTWNGSVLNINGGGTFTGNVSGGQFTTGAFTGYAWPAVNNYGTYLGPSGLLIGNANNGKYLQVTQDGNIYTPGFNVVNGTMTVNQANVINTLNLAGNAVTVPASAYSGGFIQGYTLLEAQAIGISSSGGAALLIFGAHVYSNQHEGLYLMLTRDDINIFQVGPGPAYNTKVRGEGMETGTVVDTPGAGYHVYRLYVGNPNGYYVSCQARCITYLEVKR